MNLPEKFWRRVEQVGDCHLWTGAVTSVGYGSFRFEGRAQSTHRLAYIAANGPIPDGLVIDHLCRNRTCCNPAHLEAVSQAENNRRGLLGFDLTGRCRSGRHEIKGPEDEQWRATGKRSCRACAREASARSRQMARDESAAADSYERAMFG